MWGVLEYRLRRWRTTFSSTLINSTVAPILYLAAMGVGLGGLVDDRSGGVHGVPYLDYVVPGVLALTAMQTAVGDSAYPVMSGLKWERHFEAMAATSLRPRHIAAGLLAFSGVRLVVVSGLFLLVAAVFGGVGSWWGVFALPAAVLVGLAFAGPVVAFTAALESDTGLTMLMRFGLIPLSLFAGTFFPVDVLPVGLQWLAWATPLWHGVELCRTLTTGGLDGVASLAHAGYLVVWVVAGAWLASRQLDRRLVS